MVMSACAPPVEITARAVARPAVRPASRAVARPVARPVDRPLARTGAPAVVRPISPVAPLPPIAPVEDSAAEPIAPRLDFSAIYQRWFHPVCRWARALGAIDEEIEDVAQDVFVIVQRRLPEFRNDNLAGWLYRITARSTRDQRRRAWFRRLVRVKNDEALGALAPASPSHLEQLSARMTIERILEGMGDKKRAVLMRYELEGYTGEEIAGLEAISVDTVWSRLRHAREDVRHRVDRLRRRGEL